jgi:hypothetical protein
MAAYQEIKDIVEDLYSEYEMKHVLEAMLDVAEEKYRKADEYDRKNFMLGKRPIAPRWALNIMALNKAIKELE